MGDIFRAPMSQGELLGLAGVDFYPDRQLPQNGIKVRQTVVLAETGSQVPGLVGEKHAPVTGAGVVYEDRGTFLWVGSGGELAAWYTAPSADGEWENRFGVSISEVGLGNGAMKEVVVMADRYDLSLAVEGRYRGGRIKNLRVSVRVFMGEESMVTLDGKEDQYHRVAYVGEVESWGRKSIGNLNRSDRGSGWDGVLVAGFGPVVVVKKRGNKTLSVVVWDRAVWGKKGAQAYGDFSLPGSLPVAELQHSLRQMNEEALLGLGGIPPLVAVCQPKINGRWGG